MFNMFILCKKKNHLNDVVGYCESFYLNVYIFILFISVYLLLADLKKYPREARHVSEMLIKFSLLFPSIRTIVILILSLRDEHIS